MLIQALCNYYDILASQNKVIPDGFSKIDVTYMISLNENGKVDNIIDIRDEDDRGEKHPHPVTIIKRDGISAIHSEIIEHRGLYIFGIAYSEKGKKQAQEKHTAFVKRNLDFIDGINSPIVNAFRRFVETWNPQKDINNPSISFVGKNIENSKFVFCLSGHPETLLHEDKDVIKKWEHFLSERESKNNNDTIQQCAILGEKLQIARLHNKIIGIKGSDKFGTNIICFNNDSENSYGKKQSLNSNISKLAMIKYTESFNYLLVSKYNHQYVDDTTIIYWAQNGDEEADDLMSMLAFDSEEKNEIDDEMLSSLVKDYRTGVITSEKLTKFQNMDLTTDFYFVGIKPNAARLSLKFIYKKQLGDFLQNSAQHQLDLQIIGLEKVVSIWRLKKELVSPKSSVETVNPALIAKLFDSILNDTPYPDELLQKTIHRIKIDTDIKISPVRAGIIKACINRKDRFYKKEEEIHMSLDKDNTNQAYLCGRLFAVLEEIQEKASDYSLNRTIKDSYFASAASRPACIFPQIIKLSNYHLSKPGVPKYYRDDLSEIIEKLGGEFPITLSLTEQGKFILGYYHQMNFKKINKTEEK